MQQKCKPTKTTSFLCLAKPSSVRTGVLGEGGHRLFCSPHLHLGHSETHLWRATMSLLTPQMSSAGATATPWGTGIYMVPFKNNFGSCGLEWTNLTHCGLYPMAEQAPVLTGAPPGSAASLGSCPREGSPSRAKGTLSLHRAQVPQPTWGTAIMQLQKWPEWNGKAADECAYGWSGCSVSMATRQKKISVYDFKYYKCKCGDL